jgi:uncharacterized repeat protein (TIGR01451 family)
LSASTKQASQTAPSPGATLRYTIRLKNPGPTLEHVSLTDTLPSEVTFSGNLYASSGTADVSGDTITWQGAVSAAEAVTVHFDVTVSDQIVDPRPIVNTAQIDDGLGSVWQRQATVIVNGHTTFLPLALR